MSGRRFDLPVSEGDTFENSDWLGREPLARSLSALVDNSQDPLVVALDDGWGTGKTYFLKLWEKKLREDGTPVVFFDAFENDFSSDAFVALSACLASALQSAAGDDAASTKNYFKRAGQLARIVGKSAVNISIKAATAGMVDVVDAGEAADAAIDEVGTEVGKHYENWIKAKAGFVEAKAQFSEALSQLRIALQTNDDRPLVVIVDELDRCRPNFALDILECLKHFFENERTHFVLGVNLNGLERSVVSLYGSSASNIGYLSRLIDYRVSFSPTRHSTKQRDLARYARKLWHCDEFLQNHEEFADGFSEIISAIVVKNDGGLRDINRIFSIMHVSLAARPKGSFVAPPIIGGLILMKFYDPPMFESAKEETLSFRDVSSFFGFKPRLGDYDGEERALEWSHEWWAVLMGEEVDEGIKNRLLASLSRYNFSRQSIISTSARDIVDGFWHLN